ncbi:protein kinase [Maioricimonas sp. JC845]|uniref:protein kinase domain-containing protein n=1 Tax=Maioricimonas sp. JC845 TaxID=3232138 RepID=UPI003459D774
MSGDDAYAETVTGNRAAGSHPQAGKPPLTIGRFILERELGSGAFGKVYRAYDPQLDRPVAIKLLMFGPSAEARIARFLVEAKAAAQLHHPNIVALYENGEFEGQHYIVAEFVNGHPFSALIQNAAYDDRECARWIRDVSRALAYAHEQGVIHRDIKPANIMLDVHKQPRLMDFGLAKRIDHDSSMTTDGLILGTPAYMSPEQARAEHDIVGPKADQYSMGAVLYELLTRQKPFDGTVNAVLAFKAANQVPPPIHSISPKVPRDLVAICEKAMQVSPDDRYESVSDFASDLDNYLKGRPIQARFAGPIERTIKWVRREPLVGGLSVAVAVVTIVGLLATSLLLVHALHSRSKAIASQKTAEEKQEAYAEQRDTADRLRVLATERQHQAEENRKEAEANARVAEERLSEVQKQSEELWRARNQEAEARKQAEAAAQARLEAVEREKQALEEKRLATLQSQIVSDLERGSVICEQGRGAEGLLYMIRAWNAIPDENRDRFADLADTLRQVISAERNRLAKLTGIYPSGALESEVAEIQARFGPLPFHQLDQRSNENGTRVVSWRTRSQTRSRTTVDGSGRISAPASQVVVTDRLRNRPYAQTVIEDVEVLDVALTPDNTRLAVVGRYLFGGGAVAVYQVKRQTCELIAHRIVPGVEINTVAFGPEGETLLVGADADVHILDARSLEPPGLKQGAPGPAQGLHFPANVRMVVGASRPRQGLSNLAVLAERTVWLVNLQNPAARIACQHDGKVLHGAFSADGEEFISCGDDRTARVWNVRTGVPVCRPIVHATAMKYAAFLEDRSKVVTVTVDGTPRIWQLPERRGPSVSGGMLRDVQAATFSGDGRRLLTTTAFGAALFDVTGGTLRTVRRINRRSPQGRLYGGFVQNDTQLFLVEGATLSFYRSVNGASESRQRHHLGSEAVRFVFESPDSAALLLVTDRTLKHYDPGRREATQLLAFSDDVLAGAQSHNRRHVAVALENGDVKVYSLVENVMAPKRVQTIAVQPPASALGVDSESQRLVIGRQDGAVQAWDLTEGVPLSAPLLTSGRHSCLTVAFLSDDRVSATTSTELRVWHYPTGVVVTQMRQSVDATTPVAVSPASSQILFEGRLRPLSETEDPDGKRVPSQEQLTVMTGLILTDDGQVVSLTREQWTALKNELAATEPVVDAKGDK